MSFSYYKGTCEGYNKIYIISITEGFCPICNEAKSVLVMDGSDGEYYNGGICQSCVNQAFNFFMDDTNRRKGQGT